MRPESHEASESTEARDMDWGAGDTMTSSRSRCISIGVARYPDVGVSQRKAVAAAASSAIDGRGSADAISPSGDVMRESGGETGNSGKSSRNLDMVRLGTFEFDRCTPP